MTVRELLFIWYAGLIRGAIAFGLVLRVDDFFPNRELIVTTVLSLVVFTTIFCGSTVGLLSACLFKDGTAEPVKDGDTAAAKDSGSERSEMNHPNLMQDDKSTNSAMNANKEGYKKSWFANLEDSYFRPWFVYRHSHEKSDVMDKMHAAILAEGDEMEKEFIEAKPEESKLIDASLRDLLAPPAAAKAKSQRSNENDNGDFARQ